MMGGPGPSGSPNNIGSPMGGPNNHMGPGMPSPNHMGPGASMGVPQGPGGVPGSKSSPIGPNDPMQPIPPGPGGPGGPMNGPGGGYKNNLLMGPGPTTNDPNYAQQFHDFQQQLYATNTSRSNQGGPPGMPPGATPPPGAGPIPGQNFYPGGGAGNGPA